MTTPVDVVPREIEVLVEICGLLAESHPADRRRLATVLREDALREVFPGDLPSVRALVWLAERLPALGRNADRRPSP